MDTHSSTLSATPEVMDIIQTPVFRDTFHRVCGNLDKSIKPLVRKNAYDAFLKVMKGAPLSVYEFQVLHRLFKKDVIADIFEALESSGKRDEIIPLDIFTSMESDLHIYSSFHKNFFEAQVHMILEGKLSEGMIIDVGTIAGYSFSKILNIDTFADVKYVMRDPKGQIIHGFKVFSPTIFGKDFWELFETNIRDGKGDWHVVFDTGTESVTTYIISQKHPQPIYSAEGFHENSILSNGTLYAVIKKFYDDGRDGVRVADVMQGETVFSGTYKGKEKVDVRDVYDAGTDTYTIYDKVNLKDGIDYTRIYSTQRKREVYKYPKRERQIIELEQVEGRQFAFIKNLFTQSMELYDLESGSFVFGEETLRSDFFAWELYELYLHDSQGEEIRCSEEILSDVVDIRALESESGHREFALKMRSEETYKLVLKDKGEKLETQLPTNAHFLKALQVTLGSLKRGDVPKGTRLAKAKKSLSALFDGEMIGEDEFMDIFVMFDNENFLKMFLQNYKLTLSFENDTHSLKLLSFLDQDDAFERIKGELIRYTISAFMKSSYREETFFKYFTPVGEVEGYRVMRVSFFDDTYITFGPQGIVQKTGFLKLKSTGETQESGSVLTIEDGRKILVVRADSKGISKLADFQGTLLDTFGQADRNILAIDTTDDKFVLYDTLTQTAFLSTHNDYDVTDVEALPQNYIVYFIDEHSQMLFMLIPTDEGESDDNTDYRYDNCLFTKQGEALMFGEDDEGKKVILSKKTGAVLHRGVESIRFERDRQGVIQMMGSIQGKRDFAIEIAGRKTTTRV